ncbi:hypothetical protein HGA64_04310 [Candidatus Falkowbacteria bacterium]|nr:hypothetical protein [Candidatus Falkowbacteria bacterium]
MRDAAIGRILAVAGEYRLGEIRKFNRDHVEKWVKQFNLGTADQLVILEETAHMLENYFISKEAAREALERLFRKVIKDGIFGKRLDDVNFLSTQPKGKSQSDLLLLADDILIKSYGTSLDQCGGSNNYIYLDDAIYSGNRFRYDIENAIAKMRRDSIPTIVSFHIVKYTMGFDYALGNIRTALQSRDGKLKSYHLKKLNNNRFGNELLDIFWPKQHESENVQAYIAHAERLRQSKGWASKPYFRTNQPTNPELFTTPKRQQIVEKAFLEAGSKLVCAAQKPAPSMRPMGFEVLSTIGFGTPIITWRNIANNCPLALWYGDPSYPVSHPFGQWYPLFPRKA